MSHFTEELHEAFIKISTWYQDSSIFYSMTEDESLDAYDFMYSTLRRFVDGPLPDETLTEEAKAERAAIEDMAPEVIAHLNSFISQAVFMPPIEEEDQSNIMERFDKQTIKNSSFVLAGGACLLMIAGHFFYSPDGLLPIKGFRFVAALATPMLCFWTGMLIRWKVGKPKWWGLAIAIALAGVSFYFSRHTVNILNWVEIRFMWYFLILAGFLLPWNYLYEHRDKQGIKSFVLLLITTLFYSTFELYWNRVSSFCMKPTYEDMATLLMVVTTNVIPLAVLLPVFFAAEFSLSGPAQWLGGQKWFQWIVGIAAVVSFIGTLPGLRFSFGVYDMPRWILLFVQPFTIYIIVVIYRIIRKLGKRDLTWKEVFAI